MFFVEHIRTQPEVRLLHFVPDVRKSGGKLGDFNGIVRKIANVIIVTVIVSIYAI